MITPTSPCDRCESTRGSEVAERLKGPGNSVLCAPGTAVFQRTADEEPPLRIDRRASRSNDRTIRDQLRLICRNKHRSVSFQLTKAAKTAITLDDGKAIESPWQRKGPSPVPLWRWNPTHREIRRRFVRSRDVHHPPELNRTHRVKYSVSFQREKDGLSRCPRIATKSCRRGLSARTALKEMMAVDKLEI